MQVRELVEVARFLRKFIAEKQLVPEYQNLVNAVNQAAQNQNLENFKAVLGRVRSLHEEAADAVHSPAEHQLLVEYGSDKLLGRAALARIDSIFDDNRANPPALLAAIQALIAETNAMVKRATQLIGAMEPMLSKPEETAMVGQEEGRLWLYFDEAASVRTIDDLERAAEDWKTILHHFSRIQDGGAASPRILQIQMHSPLELELAAQLGILVPLAFGISWVLRRVEHVVKILQEVQRLKQLKVKTKLIEDLQKEADEERKKIAQEGSEEVKKEFKTNNEARVAVQQGLEKILAFIEGGGKLDIHVPEDKAKNPAGPEEGEDGRRPIRQFIEGIRREIKALPPVPGAKEGGG